MLVDSVPSSNSLFDMAVKIIGRFKPSRMHRRVGTWPADLPPEAQYQDEF